MYRSSRSSSCGRRLASAIVRVAALAAVVLAAPAPAAVGAVQQQPTRELWDSVPGEPPATHRGAKADVRPERFRSFRLDGDGLEAALDAAPSESAFRARQLRQPLVLSLPAPGGGFQRFAVEESPVMEPELVRKHPEIKTYSGTGIDDAAATIRADMTPLGFHASVRSPNGAWYIDPYYHLDDSLYVSYYGRDLVENRHGPFVEREDDHGTEAADELFGQDLATLDEGPVVTLRTYRLALVTDPAYANFFGGPANVTAAKVTLLNRVTQIYEDEVAIRLVLIDENNLLNLNTTADMVGANGPCGAAPCYTPAQASTCGGATLTRNRIVIGQIVGASSYDVGHIALGVPGGGVASLGVVGGNGKAQGCTGLSTPVGDFFAVDYVSHEIGHQFAGNHTFNGTQLNCSGGNRNAANSVEPGSGSSIMAYAGICQQDDLQPHSDPYLSQRTFTEYTAFINASLPPINEVQTASLRDFGGGNEVQTVALSGFGGTDSFQLQWGGASSVPIARGTNYTAAGIQAAIEGIAGWPAGATATVTNIGGAGGTLADAGFDVTFGGTLEDTDVDLLAVVNPVGCTASVFEASDGGPTPDSFMLNYNGTDTAPIVQGTNYTVAGIQEALQGRSEAQAVSLTGYDADGDSFTLNYDGTDTVPIVRGANNTVAGIQNALQGGNEQQQVTLTGFDAASQSFQVQIGGSSSAVLGAGGLAISNANVAAAVNAIPGFAGTVTSSGAGNSGFTLTFGGASAGSDVPAISIVNCTGGCAATVRETAKGGGPLAGWPAGGTVAVSELTDAGLTLTFSGAHQGTDVGEVAVTNGTGGVSGTVAETVKGTAGVLPVGATGTVAAFGGAGALNGLGFQVTFGAGLGGVDVGQLRLTNLSGASGFVGETAQGGPVENQGFTAVETDNHAPEVTAPAAFTIPVRTPFALTGSATDSDGDTLTYMWEQNDRGGIFGGSTAGTALVNNTKTSGPLFRQFGVAAEVSPEDTLKTPSPGLNAVGTDPTRVFPDMAQIVANNTNAATGICPAGPPPPTALPPQVRDCFSEFLPTSDWVGFLGDRTLNLRLTARDGNPGAGGVAFADTRLTLAPAAGPFLVTSPNTAVNYSTGPARTITWDVAGTNAGPVGASEVKISLSVDGGETYPYVLAAATPNDGSQSVTLPHVGTTEARIRIEAVANVFFDISDADFRISSVEALLDLLEGFIDSGDVTGNQTAKNLRARLDRAARFRDQGTTDAYRSQVQAFIDQVLDNTPRFVTTEASQALVAEAALLRDGI